MYNTSSFNEDIHINNDSDAALLEALSMMNEARVYAPESDDDPFPWKNTWTSKEVAERNARKCDPPKRKSKPSPKPTPTSGTDSKPTPKPQSELAPTKKPYWENDSKVDKIRTKAIEGVVRKENGSAGNYTARNPIHGGGPSDKKPRVDSAAVKKGAKNIATKAAIAGAAAIGKQAVKDTVQHGDPLHTAKVVKASVDKKLEDAKKNRQREKDEKDFEKWLNDSKKKKVLKEDCQLLIDESTGIVYHPFVVPEGA